jgi:type III secretion protein J
VTILRANGPKHPAGSAIARAVAWAALVCVTGCSVPVAVGLDEQDANRVTAALAETGIAADKSPDPDSERKWRIDVLRDDAARAVSVLAEENLPRARAPGLLDTLDSNALVPSRSNEHTKLVAGMSGELERTLSSVNGVLSARVHLAVPAPDRLSDSEPPPPSASVLLRYRGERSPMPTGDVQRLVAGAVPGLPVDRVAVVETAVSASPASAGLVRFGPFATTKASAQKLKLLLGAAALLNVLLVSFVGVLWSRVREGRKRAPDSPTAPEAR